MAPWLRRPDRLQMRGLPTSSNGASSFHLWWDLAPGPRLVEVSARLEIVTPPAVPRLYFWALQVGFARRGRNLGAGHTGLQWTPDAPAGAVNWGGYGADGAELEGTQSAYPGVGSPNTVHWPWAPGRPYHLRVHSPEPGRWRSQITDLHDGRSAVVRDLVVDADELVAPVVWAEIFARCDDPPTVARWSDLEVLDQAGRRRSPELLRVTYQSRAEGGCDNTEAEADGDGVLQRSGLVGRRPGGRPERLRLAQAGPTH